MPPEWLRLSWRGHGWVIWVSTVATLVAALVLNWFWLSLACLAIEVVALVSLGSQVRRMRHHS